MTVWLCAAGESRCAPPAGPPAVESAAPGWGDYFKWTRLLNPASGSERSLNADSPVGVATTPAAGDRAPPTAPMRQAPAARVPPAHTPPVHHPASAGSAPLAGSLPSAEYVAPHPGVAPVRPAPVRPAPVQGTPSVAVTPPSRAPAPGIVPPTAPIPPPAPGVNANSVPFRTQPTPAGVVNSAVPEAEGTARISSPGTARVPTTMADSAPQTRSELLRQAESQSLSPRRESQSAAPGHVAGVRPAESAVVQQPSSPGPAAARLPGSSTAIARPAQDVVQASAALAPQPMRALPSLALDPPFTDEQPPIAQLSYQPPTGDAQRIARPLFNELLDEAANPSILQAGWEAPSWDAADFGVVSPRRWFSRGDSHECEECWDNPWHRLFGLGMHRASADIGIGQERVALAGFEIDSSQPFNHVRVRYDAVYGLPFPDRAEWFWAKSGKGPDSAGDVVNYQDFRVYSEVGSRMLSAIVEYPLRSLDPEINDNTTGFGDMVVGNKAVIVDGRYWQITQVFRTYINTGAHQKGLGTGHISLEPGVLARYKWTDRTYLHGEFKLLTSPGRCCGPASAGRTWGTRPTRSPCCTRPNSWSTRSSAG